MATRLADLRPQLTNLDEAKAAFAELAQTELAITKADAAAELRIAKLKVEHAERTEADRARQAEIAAQLVGFIDANRGLFVKPRKIKTDLGTFGLQTVTDLDITDEAALLTEIMERGYDDCQKVTRRPLKSPIAARIITGETFPGCTLRTGDTAVYTVDKSLIREAIASVE